MNVKVETLEVDGRKVVAEVFDDTPSWFIKYIIKAFTQYRDKMGKVQICPGGYRLEMSMMGTERVCYDEFIVYEMNDTIIVREIGYTRTKAW